MLDASTADVAAASVLPFGAWPSPIRIEDLLGDTVHVGEPWIDGDEIYWVEGRPAEAGRNVLVRRAAGRDDRRPDTGAIRRPNAGPRVRRWVVRRGRRDRGVLEQDRRAAVPHGPRRHANRIRSRLRATTASPTCGSTRAGAGSSPCARTTLGTVEPVAAIVEVPLDGDRAPRVLVEGPDFLAAPRLSPDGATPGLARVGPPRHALGLDATPGRGDPRRTASSTRPSWLPAVPTSRSPSRSGRPTASSISSATGAAGGTSTALVDGPRLEPLAPMDAEFADPAWLFGRSSYGFLPDGSIVAVGRAARAGPPVPSRTGRARPARSRRRSPSSSGCTSVRTGSSRPPPPRPRADGRRRPRSGDPGTGRRPAPGERTGHRPGEWIVGRRADHVSRAPAAATAHALFYRADQPRCPRPGRGAAAARRVVPRRPDRQRRSTRSTWRSSC